MIALLLACVAPLQPPAKGPRAHHPSDPAPPPIATTDESGFARNIADHVVTSPYLINDLGRAIAGGHDFDGNGVDDLFVSGEGDDSDGALLRVEVDDFSSIELYDVDRPGDDDLALFGLDLALGDGVLAVGTR